MSRPLDQQRLAPGLAVLRLPVTGPMRLSDLAATHLADARCAWLLQVDGRPQRPADFASVTVYPAARVEAVFRAAGGGGSQGFVNFAITALSVFALAAGAPPPLVILGASAASAASNAYFASRALIPPPQAPQPIRRADDSQNNTPSLSTAQNSARLGDPVPEIFGRRLIVPDLIAAPYTENTAGDVQQLRQYMALGVGEYAVHEVRLGSTVVWRDGAATTDAVDIEYLDPGDVSTLFPHRFVPGQTGRAELKWVDPFTWAGPVTVGSPGHRVDRLAVDIEFEGGLADYTGGGFNYHSVDFRFEYRAIGDDGAPLTAWMRLLDTTVTRVTRSAVRVTAEQDVQPRRYEIRGQVSSAQPVSQFIVNGARWTGARGFVTDSADAPDFARLAIVILNTAEFAASTAQQTKVELTRKLPEWTGSAWSAAVATRKRAAAVSYLLRGANTGNLPDAAFDVGGLWALQTGWDSASDVLDTILDVRGDLLQHTRSMLEVGLADVVPVAGVLAFYRDEARTGRQQFFGPANLLRDSVSFDAVLPGGDDYTHTEVEYPDAELDYQRVRVKCAVDGVTFGAKPLVVSASTCTERLLAWRYGMHLEASRRYRRLSGRFSAEMQGRLVMRGARVELAHPLLTDAAPSGIVLAYAAGTRAFTLSEPFAWTGGPHYLVLRDLAGKEWGPLLVTQGASPSIAIADAAALTALETATGLLVADVLPPAGQFAPFSIGLAADVATGFLVSSIAAGQGGRSYQARIVLDDPRVYTVTSGKTPPPRETVLPVPGTPAAAPDVEWLNIVFPDDGELRVEIQIPAGATAYEARLDGGTAVASTDPAVEFTGVSAGTILVEARAFGTSWGAWHGQTIAYSGLAAAPGAAGSYAVTGSPDPAAPAVGWARATNATQYRSRLLVGAVEYDVREENQGVSESWSSGEIIALGGPWAGVTVELTPQNSLGASAPQYLLIGQPGFLTGVSGGGAPDGFISVTADPAIEGVLGYAAIGGYVLSVATTPGFNPETPDVYFVTFPTPTINVGSLLVGASYYWRMAAYVGVVAGLNWSAERLAIPGPASGGGGGGGEA